MAVRYAAEHPEQVAGLVLIDGAYPIVMFDEAGKDAVRKQFRRLGGSCASWRPSAARPG
jgi:pimeloyl-ACP methyl ester carboxylesterase